MSEKVGQILYTCFIEEGCGPWHPYWDESFTEEEDKYGPSFTVSKLYVSSIRKSPIKYARMYSREFVKEQQAKEPVKVHAVHLLKGHNWKEKVRYGKVISATLVRDKIAKSDRMSWEVGKRPDYVRVTESAAILQAISRFKKKKTYGTKEKLYCPKIHNALIGRMKKRAEKSRGK